MRGMARTLAITAAVVAVWTASSALSAEKSEKISPDRLPQKVADAVRERFPGSEMASVERETENGRTVYDVELKQKGRKYEMDIEADGNVLEIEKEIAVADLPDPVRKAVEGKYSGAVVKEAMEVNLVKERQEKPDHYELVLEQAGHKTMEVIVSLDGKRIGKEGKKRSEPR